MERVVKRALFCLALVACVRVASERPTARAEVATAAPIPAERRIDLTIRFLLPGKEPSAEHAAGALIVVRVSAEPEHFWLEALDVASMRAFRSKDLGAESPVDLQAANDVVYLLTTDADAHTLRALDAGGFGELASSRVATAVPERFVDRAAPTRIEIGTRGVLVSYRAPCPKGTAEAEGGCVFYETHRLGDLAVVKVRTYAFNRISDFDRPAIQVPDDWRALPAVDEKEPPPANACPFHGTLMLGSAWVGDRYFMATSGCCGGPRGGFFECDAPQ